MGFCVARACRSDGTCPPRGVELEQAVVEQLGRVVRDRQNLLPRRLNQLAVDSVHCPSPFGECCVSDSASGCAPSRRWKLLANDRLARMRHVNPRQSFPGRRAARSCGRSLRVARGEKRGILCEMARLQLRLLGGFDLQAGPGHAVPIKRKKAQALLAYLACHPGQSHPRDKLATLLWPDVDNRQARANLRKVLFVLRSELSVVVSARLGLDEGTVRLDTGALDVDVLTFERLVRRATPETLREAAELYQGELLEGLSVTEAPFEQWLTTSRERLHDLAFEALARLLRQQTESEEPAVAVATALRLLALDPLQETVHRALMRLYVRAGRRDAALRQYQNCIDTFRRELSGEPEAETRQLYQEILRSRATPSKAARSAMADVDALESKPSPSPPLPDEAPMFGRQSELTRLLRALDEGLAGRGQLIAVLGEAGIGKSRLGSQVTVEAVKRGTLALVSHGYQTEQTLAYGLWIDALRRGGVLERDDVLSGVAVAWRAELARLFPELAQHDARSVSSPEDATRLFDAVGHLVEKLANAQPLLLVLEDVHWSDEPSLRLTSVLSRRIAAWPVVIVLTARDEEVAETPVLRDL